MGAGVFRFLVTAAGIPLCAYFLPGVTMITVEGAILAGLGLAVVYTLMRPLMRFILKIANFCTLGLVWVLVDVWLVQLAAKLAPNSVTFKSFWWALATAVIINAVRMLADKSNGDDKRKPKRK